MNIYEVVQSSILFMFWWVDKIFPVAENLGDAALEEDMSVSDFSDAWKWCLAVMATRDKCQC